MGDAALLQEIRDADLEAFYVSLPDIEIPQGPSPFLS